MSTTSTAAHALHLDWLDRNADPAEDFYRFANGGWQEANPIPPAYPRWGVFNVLHHRNQEIVHGIIRDAAAADAEAGSLTRKIGDFYASGMDTAAIDAAGLEPVAGEFERIDQIQDTADLQRVVAHLHMLGVNALFGFGAMQDFRDSRRMIGAAFQGGLGLPDRDYYLETAEAKHFGRIREAYVEHIAAMFALLGEAPGVAEAGAQTVMRIETTLAEASMPRADMRDPYAIYHIKSLAELDAVTPRFSWAAYFGDVGVPELDRINLATPGFFKALDTQLAGVPLADWKTYLRWRLIDTLAPYLATPFVEEDFRMHAVLTGAEEIKPRWQRVVAATDDALGFAVGKLYVEREFPASSKRAVLAILEDIRVALDDDLETLAWMSPATRQAAARKLSLMGERIGYPDEWRNYDNLTVTDGPYVANVIAGNVFLSRREIAKIGKPVDEHEWYMTPQTVNAYYDPSMNNINFPAGILKPPFFDPDAPAAVNYGAVGFVMGHEITHGFDDQGAKFDGHGNLDDWWTEDDLENFRQATRCITEQFGGYTVADGLSLKGELVTGEATADLGGLILAWRAFRESEAYNNAETIAGFTPAQQFFIGAAHVWASNVRASEARRLATVDPHPPARYRVNGTLANMPAFRQAFDVPDASPMVKDSPCVIW